MNADWRAPLPDGVDHRLLLVRHGEPAAEARGRCYGKLDVPLSDTGRAQIRDVARHLLGVEVEALYSSPRIRASESARLLAQNLGVEVNIDPRLAELDFGELEGRTYEEVERSHPEVFATWMQRPTEVQFPGGESHLAMNARVLSSTDEIRDRHQHSAAVVVAHGGVIRTVLADSLGLPRASIFRLDIEYASVTGIDYYGETPVVRTMNWRP